MNSYVFRWHDAGGSPCRTDFTYLVSCTREKSDSEGNRWQVRKRESKSSFINASTRTTGNLQENTCTNTKNKFFSYTNDQHGDTITRRHPTYTGDAQRPSLIPRPKNPLFVSFDF